MSVQFMEEIAKSVGLCHDANHQQILVTVRQKMADQVDLATELGRTQVELQNALLTVGRLYCGGHCGIES